VLGYEKKNVKNLKNLKCMLLQRSIFLFFLYFLFLIGLKGQGCPSIDILISSQGYVDSFLIKYPVCHEIEGDVLIYGDGVIFNLDSLYTIHAISGSLGIWNNFQLNSISGLSQLEHIGGDIRIINNDALIHLYGLERINSIDTLFLKRNGSLEDVQGLNGLKVAYHIELEDMGRIEGFDSLDQVTTDFRMSSLSMQTCEGVPLLDTVGGTLSLSDAPFLQTLNGFDALQYAGSVHISNTGIKNFEGMAGLAVIESNLSIRANDSLQSIQGLESLIRIGGDVDIIANNKLSDLGDLNFLTEVTGDLIIANNDSLRHLDDLAQLRIVYGDVDISRNDQMQNIDGLHSLMEVQGDVFILENNIIDVDGLQLLRKIGGNLKISRNDSLQDLSGLNQIDTIGGDFELNSSWIDTLDGINNLKSVGGQLYFFYNDRLLSITGLNSLQYVGGLRMEEHRRMNSITGFGNLKQINGDCEFISNWRLQHLPSLPGITRIEGDLILSNWPDLIDMSGLDSLRSLGGRLELWSTYLDSLHGLEQLESCVGGLTLYNLTIQDLDPLSNLKFIDGPLSISEMFYLTNIQGLRNLDPSSIYSFTDSLDIIIRDNPYLENCSIDIMCEILDAKEKQVHIQDNSPGCDSPLDILTKCHFPDACLPDGITFSRQSQIDSFRILYPQCTFIQGDVRIEEGVPGEIINLDSLSNVQTLGGNLRISSNLSLTNLDGLSSLATIGGGIRIYANDNLSSLNGLANIDPLQLTMTRPHAYDLWLYTNPLLNSCAISSVCGILENPEATVVVQANGIDCSDPEIIRMDCLVSVNTLPGFPSLELYPNPTSGELHISTLTFGEKPFEYMDIYNSTGARVLHGFFESKLALAFLDPGVYTIVCLTKDLEIATGRFMMSHRW